MFSKTLYLSALILGTVTSFASAGYTVTSPASGAVLNGGDSAKVLWTGADGPTIDVNLMKGSASNLQMVKQLCKGIDPKVGECDFTVDSSWTSERDYAIQLGTPSDYGYSSYFTIQANGALPVSSGCPNMGGQNCPQSLPCCSSSGYCGSSDAYCGTGCVAKYSFNGVCQLPGAASSAASQATTAAAQVTTAAAQATSSAASSVTSAASSVTSAAAEATSAAAAPITNPVSDPDSDSDYTGHGPHGPYGPHQMPCVGRNCEFFNIPNVNDPNFGNEIKDDIDDQFEDASKKFGGFKNYLPKRRRGIILRRRQA